MVSQILSSVCLALYMVTWWLVVWILSARREGYVVPFCGVLLCGCGVPLILSDFMATSENPLPVATAFYFWLALPFVIVIGAWMRCVWMRRRR